MAQLDSRSGDFALLLLRIGVGMIFIMAGWEKLTGIEQYHELFVELGIFMPDITVWVVAVVEFFGGIMVVLGAYSKIWYLLLAIIMAVAIYTTKLDGEFNAARLEIMLLVTNLALFFLGSGRYSFDYKLTAR